MKLINLIPLKEIDFSSQGAFDTYSKAHKLRPDTKVKIAGKTTTAGRAAQNSAPVKGGTSVFGKDKGGDVFGGKTPSNYAFTPKDAEKKYKSSAISMLIPKLNPKDIPNIQKQLSKMDVDADFNVEKDGVRVWTRSGDYSNVGDVLKSKGLKRKQTMPTDADYQKWDDKLRASSGIKPTGGDENPQTAIKNIADLTDNNDHNGAVMALAKMMGDKSSTAEMEKIQKYHNSKGHMPQSLTKYRSSILNNLLVQAKKKYGDKIVKQLHSSF